MIPPINRSRNIPSFVLLNFTVQYTLDLNLEGERYTDFNNYGKTTSGLIYAAPCPVRLNYSMSKNNKLIIKNSWSLIP